MYPTLSSSNVFKPFSSRVVDQEFLRVFLYTTARTLSHGDRPPRKGYGQLFVPENLYTLQLRRIICDRAVSMIKVSVV